MGKSNGYYKGKTQLFPKVNSVGQIIIVSRLNRYRLKTFFLCFSIVQLYFFCPSVGQILKKRPF